MTLAVAQSHIELDHPLDMLEHAVEENGWPFERSAKDELNLSVAGRWCDYHLCFTWRESLQSLHLTVNFDMRVSAERRTAICDLLAGVNAQLFIGHFDMWAEDGAIVYRHVLIFPDSTVSAAQCEALMQLAVEACEHYYPAFQFVLWGNKSAKEAMAAAVLEVAGQA